MTISGRKILAWIVSIVVGGLIGGFTSPFVGVFVALIIFSLMTKDEIVIEV